MLADGVNLTGALILDLKIHHILFNEQGRYSLKFCIQSSRGDERHVKLYLDKTKDPIYDYEFDSQPCYQGNKQTPCHLDYSDFRFEMPKGKIFEDIIFYREL